MGDGDRDNEVAALRERLSTLKAKRAALAEECVRMAVWIYEIRKEFGNPFYYSHPTEPDEGFANYTGNRSHEIGNSLTSPGMLTLSEFMRVERDIAHVKEQLRQLGALEVK
jgi:hypothetical protein